MSAVWGRLESRKNAAGDGSRSGGADDASGEKDAKRRANGALDVEDFVVSDDGSGSGSGSRNTSVDELNATLDSGTEDLNITLDSIGGVESPRSLLDPRDAEELIFEGIVERERRASLDDAALEPKLFAEFEGEDSYSGSSTVADRAREAPGVGRGSPRGTETALSERGPPRRKKCGFSLQRWREITKRSDVTTCCSLPVHVSVVVSAGIFLIILCTNYVAVELAFSSESWGGKKLRVSDLPRPAWVEEILRWEGESGGAAAAAVFPHTTADTTATGELDTPVPTQATSTNRLHNNDEPPATTCPADRAVLDRLKMKMRARGMGGRDDVRFSLLGWYLFYNDSCTMRHIVLYLLPLMLLSWSLFATLWWRLLELALGFVLLPVFVRCFGAVVGLAQKCGKCCETGGGGGASGERWKTEVELEDGVGRDLVGMLEAEEAADGSCSAGENALFNVSLEDLEDLRGYRRDTNSSVGTFRTVNSGGGNHNSSRRASLDVGEDGVETHPLLQNQASAGTTASYQTVRSSGPRTSGPPPTASAPFSRGEPTDPQSRLRALLETRVRSRLHPTVANSTPAFPPSELQTLSWLLARVNTERKACKHFAENYGRHFAKDFLGCPYVGLWRFVRHFSTLEGRGAEYLWKKLQKAVWVRAKIVPAVTKDSRQVKLLKGMLLSKEVQYMMWGIHRGLCRMGSSSTDITRFFYAEWEEVVLLWGRRSKMYYKNNTPNLLCRSREKFTL